MSLQINSEVEVVVVKDHGEFEAPVTYTLRGDPFVLIITDIDFDTSGNLITLDPVKRRVRFVDLNRGFPEILEDKTISLDDFNRSAVGVTKDVDGESIWVCDIELKALLKYSTIFYRYAWLSDKTFPLHAANLRPEGIAYANDGTFYIASRRFDNIYSYAPNGTRDFSREFALKRPENSTPSGISVDSEGNIWVVDTDGMVYSYTSSGQYRRQSSFRCARWNNRPEGIYIDPNDDVFWILDQNKKIYRYTPEGQVILSGIISIEDSTDGEVFGLTKNDTGSLFVVGQTAQKIFELGVDPHQWRPPSDDYTLTTQLSGDQSDANTIVTSRVSDGIHGLTRGSDGNYYIIDGHSSRRVHVYTPAGAYVRNYQLTHPVQFNVLPGTFDPVSGDPMPDVDPRLLGTFGDLDAGIAFDSSRNVYWVLGHTRIFKYNLSFELQPELEAINLKLPLTGDEAFKSKESSFETQANDNPQGVAISRDNNYLYVVQKGRGRVRALTSFDKSAIYRYEIDSGNWVQYSLSVGDFFATPLDPTGVFVDAAGYVWVLDNMTGVLAQFRDLNNESSGTGGTLRVVSTIVLPRSFLKRGLVIDSVGHIWFGNQATRSFSDSNRSIYSLRKVFTAGYVQQEKIFVDAVLGPTRNLLDATIKNGLFRTMNRGAKNNPADGRFPWGAGYLVSIHGYGSERPDGVQRGTTRLRVDRNPGYNTNLEISDPRIPFKNSGANPFEKLWDWVKDRIPFINTERGRTKNYSVNFQRPTSFDIDSKGNIWIIGVALGHIEEEWGSRAPGHHFRIGYVRRFDPLGFEDDPEVTTNFLGFLRPRIAADSVGGGTVNVNEFGEIIGDPPRGNIRQTQYVSGLFDLQGIAIDENDDFYIADRYQKIIAKYRLDSDGSLDRISGATISIDPINQEVRSMTMDASGDLLILSGGEAPYTWRSRDYSVGTSNRLGLGLDRPAQIHKYSTRSYSHVPSATISIPKIVTHASGDISSIVALPFSISADPHDNIYIGYRAPLGDSLLADGENTSTTYLRYNLSSGTSYETSTLSSVSPSMPEPLPTQSRLIRDIPLERSGAGRSSGVTADNNGDLWVLDASNNEVRKYGRRRDTLIPRFIPLAQDNTNARGLSSDSDGLLYVPDDDTKQVFVYDPFNLNYDNESFDQTIDLNSENQGNVGKIATAPNGNFFIESERNKLFHYNFFGAQDIVRNIDMVETRGIADNVTAIAVDSKYDLWILVSNDDGTYSLTDQYKLIANNPLPPRFLKFGFINTEEDVYSTEDDTLFSRFREYSGPPIINLYSVHLVSFNNILGENREHYFNALKSPPVVTETLSSLTTSMSSFNNVSVTLSDPNVRGFFDGGFGFSATQNPIRIYRIVCGKRIQVWNGYLDGYSVNRGHEISLSMRSIMKKFDQMATFGFTKTALQRWGFNQNKIPIVAARVIPWSPSETEHSAVGCATFSLRGRDISSGNAFLRKRERDVNAPSGDEFFEVEGYENRMLDYAYEPIFAGTPNSRKSFEESEPDPDQEKRNERLIEHLETTKKPTYVSFELSTLPRSKINIEPDGDMVFDRGIFFAPVDEASEAKVFFRPNKSNYRESLVPFGASADTWRSVRDPLWAVHAEKFFWGQRDFPVRNTGDFSDIRTGLFFQISNTKMGDNTKRLNANGFDNQSLFPALDLGESYASWTSIALPRGPSESSTLNAYFFPPRNGEHLETPLIEYHRGRVAGGNGYPDPDARSASNDAAQPLDSFYRSTISALGELRPSGLYFRGVMYTPHQLSLCYLSTRPEQVFGPVSNLILGASKFEPTHYFYTQFATYTVYDSNGLSNQSTTRIENQAEEFERNYLKVKTDVDDKKYIWWELPRSANLVSGGYLSSGVIEEPMARSKDMYVTLADFQRNHKIKSELLDVKHPTSSQLSSMIQKDFVPNVDYKSNASRNLRLMPAYPHGLTEDGEMPNISCEGENGAFIVTARYKKLNEVGYWDTSTDLNESAHENVEQNFAAYYHHDQYQRGYNFTNVRENKGVAPYSFLYAVIKAMKLEPDWDHWSNDYTEMTNWNPVQLISESTQSYKSLIDRLMPGLGKFLRWNPRTSKVEIKTWLTAEQEPLNIGTSANPGENIRVIDALFDEDCLTFASIQNTAASIPSSFVFENPDMLRGTQTMHEFSDNERLLARYVRLRSTVFIQGKIVNLKTGTWCMDSRLGLQIYESISNILSNRADIVEFTVPSEVLLGQGFGHVGVGSWVRLLTPAFTGGAADVYIKEATSSELETRFRALRFQGVGIQNADENIMAPASVPQSEDDIEGDDGPTDDKRKLAGPEDTNIRRLYY